MSHDTLKNTADELTLTINYKSNQKPAKEDRG